MNNSKIKKYNDIFISIPLIVYNDENRIKLCIESILNQTYKNFELIIIDDHSTDNSLKIIKEFSDERIKIFENKSNIGITKNRNNSIQLSKGVYLFFTDSDCVPDKEWITNGLNIFSEINALGVEGETCYVSKGYLPSISDMPPGTQEVSGNYMTCNMAYRKDILNNINGFDEKYSRNADRELAFRVMALGDVIYCNEMKVMHVKKTWSIKGYICSGSRVKDRVYLYKHYGDKSLLFWRIVYPINIIKILIPPLVLWPLVNNKIRSWSDVKLIPFIYIKLLYERYIIWKTAIREKILLI